MGRRSREDRMLTAVRKVLDRDEQIVDRGRCWAAVRRVRVPLLFLGRHQYDAFVTNRRIMLFSRSRRRSLKADDVALVKRFGALVLDAERRGPVLVQQRIRTDTGTAMVLEWPYRSRRIGRMLAAELDQPTDRRAA